MRRLSARDSTLVVLTVALLLRLAPLAVADGLVPIQDEIQYLRAAASIAETGAPVYPNPVWDEAHASPGYPYLFGAIHVALGPEHVRLGMRLVQILLGVLTVAFVYRIALAAFDPRVAIASAWCTALYPTLIGYTHYFYSETLYVALLTGFVALLVHPTSARWRGLALAAGVAAGALVLTRSAFLLQIPIVAGWLAWRGRPLRRPDLAAVGLLAVGLALTVGPWTLRSSLRYDRFLLVDTNAGNVLHKNWNALWPEAHDVGLMGRWERERSSYRGSPPFRPRVREAHPVDRNDAEIRAAVAWVLAHPGRFIRNCVRRAAEWINPTSYVVRALRWDAYGPVARPVEELVVLSVLLSTMAALLLGTLGLLLVPMTGARALPALLILAQVGTGVLVVATSRYRLPAMPLLIPFAATAWLGWRSLPRPREAPVRWALAGALVCGMGVAWLAYVPLSFVRA